MEDNGVSCSPSCLPFSRVQLSSSDTEDNGSDEVDGLPKSFRHRSSKRYKKTVYWVSLLDGLQRVLLFTEDGQLASKARKVRKFCTNQSSLGIYVFNCSQTNFGWWIGH